jgi:hypothetical protein
MTRLLLVDDEVELLEAWSFALEGVGYEVVCGRRYLGCDSALGRHEGLEGDRGDQQGSRSTDLQRCGLRPYRRSFYDCPRSGRAIAVVSVRM